MLHLNMSKEEKKSSIKTLEDKGTKVDFIDLGDGRQIFIYQTEKFRGLSIGAFKLGWTNKYDIISPGELTKDTLEAMARTGSAVSGQVITPEYFEVRLKVVKDWEEEG
jgi:hypothetical protein